MSISGVTFGAIKLQALIAGFFSQMSSRYLIAGYTVVPGFSRKPITLAQVRTASLPSCGCLFCMLEKLDTRVV